MIAGRIQLMHRNTYPTRSCLKGTVYTVALIIYVTRFGGGDWICRRVGIGEDGVTSGRLFLIRSSVPHPVVTFRSNK